MTIDPSPHTLWKHRNGIIYRVLMIANEPDEPRYPRTVVYQNVVNHTIWARRFDDWHRSFTLYEPEQLNLTL